MNITRKDVDATAAEIVRQNPGYTTLQGEKLTSERVRKAFCGAFGVSGVDQFPKGASEGRVFGLMLSSNHGCIGVVVNPNSGLCRMEGCTGRRMHVRWEDGSRTYPCSKGCTRVGPHVNQIGIAPIVIPEFVSVDDMSVGMVVSADEIEAAEWTVVAKTDGEVRLRYQKSGVFSRTGKPYGPVFMTVTPDSCNMAFRRVR